MEADIYMDPRNSRLAVQRPPSSLDSITTDRIHPLSDLELHYDFDSSNNVIGTLRAIAQDLSSHRSIHNWDEKLVPDPVKDLAIYANRQLSRLDFRDGSFMLRYSSVDEVCTTNGINRKIHAHDHPFPSAKVSSHTLWKSQLLMSNIQRISNLLWQISRSVMVLGFPRQLMDALCKFISCLDRTMAEP